MADVFTKAKRSQVMARIRSRGNIRTELAMVAMLRANRIWGWRRHVRITGRPDFVFREPRVALFVDGCFWHSCTRCHLKPADNREFWRKKLGANRKRDRNVNRALRAKGWTVLRIWEHEMRNSKRVLKKLLAALGQEPRSWGADA